MGKAVEMLALADAMQLHKERVQKAERTIIHLRESLDYAERTLRVARRAQEVFIAGVKAESTTTEGSNHFADAGNKVEGGNG